MFKTYKSVDSTKLRFFFLLTTIIIPAYLLITGFDLVGYVLYFFPDIFYAGLYLRIVATVTLIAALILLLSFKRIGIYIYYISFLSIAGIQVYELIKYGFETQDDYKTFAAKCVFPILILIYSIFYFCSSPRRKAFKAANAVQALNVPEDEASEDEVSVEEAYAPDPVAGEETSDAIIEEAVENAAEIPVKKSPVKKAVFSVLSSIFVIFIILCAYDLMSTIGAYVSMAIMNCSQFTYKLFSYPFPGNVPTESPFNALLEVVLLLFTLQAIFFLNRVGLLSIDELGVSKKKKPVLSVLGAFFIGIVLVLLAALITQILGCHVKANTLFPRIIFTICMGLIYYLGIGVVEEFFFRGVIQQYFTRKYNAIVGIIISAVMFVAIHRIYGVYYSFYKFIFLFFFALLESFVFITYKNLWLCMGIHFGYDWGIIHLFELNTGLHSGNAFFLLTKMINWKSTFSISLACIILSVVFLIIYYWQKKKVG